MTPNEIEWAAHDIAHDRRGGESVIGYIILALVTAIVIAAVLCGCVYRGAKVTEGTDLAVGLEVPATDGALQLDVVNYLTGFRLGVAENAILKVQYTSASTNDWLGIIHNATTKTIDATVEPCATDDKESTK